MRHLQILFNPGYEVILECALDDLMENVWRYECMDIRPREVVCEWL